MAADDYSQWTYSKPITLNASSSGANSSNDVHKFPVLVRLASANAADVFNNANANGSDARFSKSSGAHLSYEIERWDKTNKLAEIWVLVDTIKSHNASQSITMYWGNASAVDSSKSTAVFDTANGFQGVWHFGEGNNSSANDATKNNYDGAASGTTPPADASGLYIVRMAAIGLNGKTSGVFEKRITFLP